MSLTEFIAVKYGLAFDKMFLSINNQYLFKFNVYNQDFLMLLNSSLNSETLSVKPYSPSLREGFKRK